MFKTIQHGLGYLSHSFGNVKSRLFIPLPAAPVGQPVTLSTDYHSTDRSGSSFDMTLHDHIEPQCPYQPLPQPGILLLAEAANERHHIMVDAASLSNHDRPLARPHGHTASLMTIDPCLHSTDFRDSPDTPGRATGREGGLW